MVVVVENATKPSRFAHFDKVHNPLRLPGEATSEPPKGVQTPGVFSHFDFDMCLSPQQRALFRHLNFQKWSEPLVFFNILTLKCASRHNGVHFFDIATSKCAPSTRCFVHFDLQLCFAPQRRALFHLSSGQLAPHPPL